MSFLALGATMVLVTVQVIRWYIIPEVQDITNWRQIRNVKTHNDFTTLPDDIHFHTAFAYASYETPNVSENKMLFKTLRGYSRVENPDFYSIFEKISDDTVRYVVAIRGTNPVDARDLWQDVLIAFKNDPSGRKHKLITNLREFLDSIKNKHQGKQTTVTFTGHSLGGTVCAQVYNALKKCGVYNDILEDSYAFNPGVSPIPSTDGTRLWKDEILADPDQHIIVTEGDLVGLSLILLVESPRAHLHVITGLDFDRRGFAGETKRWFQDMKNGTGNILPNKIQAHDLPAFFTLCARQDSLTRAQVNRYLEIEEHVRLSRLPSFEQLSSAAQRALLCRLVEMFNVETDWKEQAFEVTHREIRRMSGGELKRAIDLTRLLVHRYADT